MIEFLATEKESVINGIKLTVKRLGIGYYYRFLSLLIDYKIALLENLELSENLKKDDYELKDNDTLIIGKIIIYKDKLIQLANYFVDIKLNDLELEDLFGIIEEIIDFNNYDTGKKGDKIKTIDDYKKYTKNINDNFNFIISYMAEMGKDWEYISENINNVQASIMIENWNKNRIQVMNDMRFAFNAKADEFQRYVNSIKGIKNMSVLDFLTGDFDG